MKNTQNQKQNYLQIEAADKQRKQDLKFLDEQAAEREVERDEFLKEIEKLRTKLRDKEKDRVSYESYVEEVCSNAQPTHHAARQMNSWSDENETIGRHVLD